MNIDPHLHHQQALKIQKTWRGYKVRKFEKPERLSETQKTLEQIRQCDAALSIQSFFKIVLAKRRLLLLQQQRREKQKLATLTLIQAILRQRQSRIFEFSIKRFAPMALSHQIKIAKICKGFLTRLQHGDIRGAYRRYDGHRKINDSASVIQALIRGVLTRSKLQVSIGGLMIAGRVEEGAVIFQRVCRGFQARQKLHQKMVDFLANAHAEMEERKSNNSLMSSRRNSTASKRRSSTASLSSDEMLLSLQLLQQNKNGLVMMDSHPFNNNNIDQKQNQQRRRSIVFVDDETDENNNIHQQNSSPTFYSQRRFSAFVTSVTREPSNSSLEDHNNNNNHHHQNNSVNTNPLFSVAGASSSVNSHEWNPHQLLQQPFSSNAKPKLSAREALIEKKKIIRCQSIVRRFFERNTLFQLKLERFKIASRHLRAGCAVVVQKHWRGFLQRRSFVRELQRNRAASLLHGVVAGYFCRAFDLASLHHYKLIQQRIDLEHRCVTKIASIVKMFFAKKQVWGMNRLVARIQRVCRAREDRRVVRSLLRTRSAIRIQRKVRSWIKQRREKKRYEMLREALAAEQERNLAAVLIQSGARRLLARTRFVLSVGLGKLKLNRARRFAKELIVKVDEKKRFREARENMLARRVQQRWFGYTTLIRENYEILRLETKLEGISVRGLNSLERTHRMLIQDQEYGEWVMDMSNEISIFNGKVKELLKTLLHWHEERQYIPAQMIRLYEAQRFLRGAVTRKKYMNGTLNHDNYDDHDANDTNYDEDHSNVEISNSSARSLLQLSSARRKFLDNSSSAKELRHDISQSLSHMKEQHSITEMLSVGHQLAVASSITPRRKRGVVNSQSNPTAMFLHQNTNDGRSNNPLDQHKHENPLSALSPILKQVTGSSPFYQSSLLPASTASSSSSSQVLIIPPPPPPPASDLLLLPLSQRELVDLSYTYLSIPLMQKYFINLRFSATVRHLDVSHCSLGDDAASYVIELCTGLEKLQYLNLSHNPFTNIAATKILAWLEGVTPTASASNGETENNLLVADDEQQQQQKANWKRSSHQQQQQLGKKNNTSLSNSAGGIREIDLSNTLVSRCYKRCVEQMLKVEAVSGLDLLRRRVMEIELAANDL